MEALEELIIDLYVNQKLGQQECAKRAGVNFEKVVSILKKNGVHIRTPQEARQLAKELGRVRKVKPLQDWQKDKIIECYVNQKRGLVYTQKQAKCSKAQLDNFLAEQGINKRTYGEAAIFSNQNRALGKDKEYFYHQSPNMAWILGFLASDGYVLTRENTIGWGLSAKDGEILERIRKEMKIEKSVKYYSDRKGFDYASLEWTCAEHKTALAEYSITPKKTFTLKPPYKLDKKYWIDYIRGYFDGDGSINLIHTHGKPSALRWQVCSATKVIIDFIVDFFYNEYGIPKVKIQETLKKSPHSDKQGLLYVAQYSTNPTKKIHRILYNTDSTLYLARKKEHFDEIVSNY